MTKDPPKEAKHSRVSLGKAGHRCHGDMRCLEVCIMKQPPAPPPKRWFRGPDGKWTR